MNLLSITLLQSAAAGAGAPQGGGASMWIMLLLIFGVMYLFMIRPQRKQQKEQENFIKSLGKGSKVMTRDGILGTITEVKDDIAVVRIDGDVKIRVLKSALQRDPFAAAPAPAAKEDKAPAKEEKAPAKEDKAPVKEEKASEAAPEIKGGSYDKNPEKDGKSSYQK
ncbi:MAG: preprotein translocase subunit YajC [Bacteroidales bacterium]|nr:preprotein translocase subunit YajC [Bacteroidales bacterium]